jgi:hypothetical protein
MQYRRYDHVLEEAHPGTAQLQQETWQRAYQDEFVTVFIPPMLNIGRPSYVKALVIPKELPAIGEQAAPNVSNTWLTKEPAAQSPRDVAPWWDRQWDNVEQITNSQTSPTASHSEPLEQSITHHSEPLETIADDPASVEQEAQEAIEQTDAAGVSSIQAIAIQIGRIQRIILKWLYESSNQPGDELPWSVGYQSKDNASRRVVFSKALKALEHRGLVERIKQNSRTRAVKLTSLGWQVAQALSGSITLRFSQHSKTVSAPY